MSDDPSAEWFIDMSLDLMLLRDDLPDEVRLDFTPGSLMGLEDHLLGRFYARADFASEHEAVIVSGLVRYVGEVLLDVGGGQWERRPGPESEPAQVWVVRLDAVPEPVSPFELLVQVVTESTAWVLTDAVDGVRRAVLGRVAREPGWRPRKVPTPRLDPVVPVEEAAEAERWAAGFTASGDFSPQSLEDLERRARAGDVGGADAWYLGEVLRLSAGGRWRVTAGRAVLVRATGRVKEEEVILDPAEVLAGLAREPQGALQVALSRWEGREE